MAEHSLVPFGKYKGQPVEVIAEDRGYCEWLLTQAWFVERFPQLRTVIINNFGEPAETPEHNALQLRFLDEALRLKVTMCLALFHQPGASWFRQGTYGPLLSFCTMPTFEDRGIDVQWRAGLWYPYHHKEDRWRPGGAYAGTSVQHWQQATATVVVECKPSLGDDYPAVLRFLKSLPRGKDDGAWVFKVLVADHYSFRGGTIEQVQQFFQASGVLLLDIAGLERLPAIACLSENDLPAIETVVNTDISMPLSLDGA